MNQKLMQIETQGGGGATFLYIFTLNGACGWVSNHIVFYHYADWSRENGELLWLVKSSNNVSLPFSVTISLYSELLLDNYAYKWANESKISALFP